MTHMRLMPHMCGMCFSCNKLSSSEKERTREIVSSLKRLTNALQALMSVLMSRAQPDERTTDNHMKLFMSTAFSLHKGCGSLSQKPKGKKDRIADKLLAQELIRILTAFGVSEGTSQGSTAAGLQNQVDGTIVKVLKTKCSELGHGTNGLESALQKRAFEHILEKSIVDLEETQTQETETQGEEGENDGGTRPNDKRMCWNKGNWLSFLANISAQMKCLGPLPLIWQVKQAHCSILIHLDSVFTGLLFPHATSVQGSKRREANWWENRP